MLWAMGMANVAVAERTRRKVVGEKGREGMWLDH